MHQCISMWTLLLITFPEDPTSIWRAEIPQNYQLPRYYMVWKVLWDNVFLNLSVDYICFHGKVIVIYEIKGSLEALLKPSGFVKHEFIH